jgi:hypothetical protein
MGVREHATDTTGIHFSKIGPKFEPFFKTFHRNAESDHYTYITLNTCVLCRQLQQASG